MRNYIKKLIVNNYTINSYYGGFGNNLQQLALGIMYSNLYKKNFFPREHNLLNSFSIINNSFSANILRKYRFDSRFFYYESSSEKFTNNPKTDSPLKNRDSKYYIENFNNVFQETLGPNLNFTKNIDIGEDTLVMHIRSGDVFEKRDDNGIFGNQYYLQNPLVYYKKLIENYENTIIVSSTPLNNPVIEKLKNNKKVEISSSNLEEDFNLLLNAKNLATSGVGTFAIAAALSSKKLINFHYSNLYFNHHLNPTMVKNVNHHKYRFNGYLNIGDKWDGDKKQVQKMLSSKIEVIDI
tara:strand:- start:1473 stop:2357 length:885 start_codon:yes stop_codon:yes gene_type:complete